MFFTRLFALSLTLLVSCIIQADGSGTFEQMCSACHGKQAEGNPALNAPKLAGQDDWYIKNQLNSFRQGYRGTAEGDASGASMAAISKSLDSNKINELALYLNALPKPSIKATVKGDAVKGEQYYNSLCGSCHGPDGKGNTSLNAPKLAGLNDWYIINQINNFRASKRGYHQDDKLGRQMKMMSSVVPSDEASNDIATYLSAQ